MFESVGVYTSSANLAAYGCAEGPNNPFHSNQLTLAPETEIAYLNYFGDTKWFGVAKFFYEYLFTQALIQFLDKAPLLLLVILLSIQPKDRSIMSLL